MKNTIALSLLLIGLLSFASCSKDDSPTSTTPDHATQAAVLSDLANNVIVADYAEIDSRVQTLYADIQVLQDSSKRTDAALATAQQGWRDVRASWESCEGFLLGPVESLNIDPNIDTWPVSFSQLDSLQASNLVFTPENVEGIEQDLKGFHPIEYILFGKDGQKHASELTIRELDYLGALTLNVKKKSHLLVTSWDSTVSGSYYSEFTKAGNGSTVYPTRRSAFQDVVRVMGDICEEVGGGKLREPFDAKDPSLEESPFSGNSITDFTHNIQGVQNIYLGMYGVHQGKGLSDLVKANNLALDNKVKSGITNAIASLQAITVPFGRAISEQPTQVKNAMDAINALHDVIEDDLAPYVLQFSN